MAQFRQRKVCAYMDTRGGFSPETSSTIFSLISCVVLRLIADFGILLLECPERFTMQMAYPVVIIVKVVRQIHQILAVDVDPGKDVNVPLIRHALDLADDGLPQVLALMDFPLDLQFHVSETDRFVREAGTIRRRLHTVCRVVHGLNI